MCNQKPLLWRFSFRSAGRFAAAAFPILLWLGCGQVYRPVVIPCSGGVQIPGCPVQPPPVPATFHQLLGISVNTPGNPGGAMQVDVGGDSIIAETALSGTGKPNDGFNPTHAAIIPNNSRVFAASAGSMFAGGLDSVLTFAPAFQSTIASGFGPVTTIPLPQGSLPVFLNTAQNGFMYVANFGNSSVSAINTSLNAVSNTATVGTNPVALAETPNGEKLYVANQGSDSVSTLNTTDLSPNTATGTVLGFSGVAPVWAVARGDSQKVYVLTQGDGQLVTIDEATDTVTGSLPVGAGANYVFYDPNLNRLYVTNPVTAAVYVFSDTGGPNDTPFLLATISFAAGSTPCPTGCSPNSVTALADGSRFYVASYQLATVCPDPFMGATPCVIPTLTVFNANNFDVQYPNTPTMGLLTYPPFSANLTTNQYQSAVPQVAACAPAAAPALYSPGTTRFRVFTAAAVGSTRVYVSICDGGVIAVINTTGNNANNGGGTPLPPDSLITDLPAAPSICPRASCGSTASITAFSISSNVVTFQAANAFSPGQNVSISGLTTGTFLNGLTLTVLTTGLSSSQFEAYFTNPNLGLTTDSGIADPSLPTQTPIFLLTGQ